MRKKASEPPMEIDADTMHFKVFPNAKIIRMYRRYISNNVIKVSSKPIASIRLADFKNCPESWERFKAWINTWTIPPK